MNAKSRAYVIEGPRPKEYTTEGVNYEGHPFTALHTFDGEPEDALKDWIECSLDEDEPEDGYTIREIPKMSAASLVEAMTAAVQELQGHLQPGTFEHDAASLDELTNELDFRNLYDEYVKMARQTFVSRALAAWKKLELSTL